MRGAAQQGHGGGEVDRGQDGEEGHRGPGGCRKAGAGSGRGNQVSSWSTPSVETCTTSLVETRPV